MVKISILGYGWLGSKLGSFLSKKAYSLNGSTRSGKIEPFSSNDTVIPYLINIADNVKNTSYDEGFFNCDVLIISLKPTRQYNDLGYFENQIKVCTKLAIKYKVKHIIFWSSTSVYGDYNQISNEDSELIPTRPSGNSLIRAENILLNQSEFSTTVLRLGGLIGYERTPFEVLKNAKKTGGLYIPVNLVHADDVIKVTKLAINHDANNIYNVVADAHPLRIAYYKQAFNELGASPSDFDWNAQHNFKIVDNNKVKKELNYEFLLKNPVDLYTYQALLSK